ncbi:Multi antimicrobial extrusion protein [Dillenia turbinata]|uniref:Multi antimicrobial extrusion protein n=1 Tax=Dillenia turbinata TaxID=194707 RepID=A0AAN8VCD9_9MAGN
MGSALETFCGQAYGAKQYHMLGIHMQRVMLVLVLISIPIAVLWIYTEHIFLVIRQEKDISSQAGQCSGWLIPSIVPYGLLQCQFRFLQAQNNVSPLMISTGITSASLAISISYWVNVLILALYIRFSATCKKTWTGFSKEGTENLINF